MDIPEYTFKEVGYSGSLQDIANILEYPQKQVLFSGILKIETVRRFFINYIFFRDLNMGLHTMGLFFINFIVFRSFQGQSFKGHER